MEAAQLFAWFPLMEEKLNFIVSVIYYFQNDSSISGTGLKKVSS